jgi:hypothetical protein
MWSVLLAKQRSLVLFLWAKELYAKDTHKEIFPVYIGKCLSSKAVHNWDWNPLIDVRKSQIMHDQVRKWLRQQPEYFYAAGFDALLMRWDMCINIYGGYAEK